MYKEYSDSYLMKMTKKQLIKQLRAAEHNFKDERERLKNVQAVVKRHRFITFTHEEKQVIKQSLQGASVVFVEDEKLHDALLHEIRVELGEEKENEIHL